MTDATSLSGKVALITGGSRGIGATVARRFAAAGGQVAIGYQARGDVAARLSADITRAGGQCVAVKGDITDADAVLGLPVLDAELPQSQGRRVLKVGDGINDAPALAEAYVSLSPISAAELTQAQADAVFLGARLAPGLDAVTTSRKARALMRQNLILAVIYNVFAIPIAVAGLVTPLIAALAMSGSSMLVTINALRVSTRREALEIGSGSAAAAMQMQPVGP